MVYFCESFIDDLLTELNFVNKNISLRVSFKHSIDLVSISSIKTKSTFSKLYVVGPTINI